MDLRIEQFTTKDGMVHKMDKVIEPGIRYIVVNGVATLNFGDFKDAKDYCDNIGIKGLMVFKETIEKVEFTND